MSRSIAIFAFISNANARLERSMTINDSRSEGAGSHSASVTLAIRLLVVLLNLFLINVGIILVHVADERQGRVEEGGVLVTVRVVLVGSADGGVTVDYKEALN